MSHNPERRLSTGGLPPIRVREQCVVEKVPSHHDPGVPCYTAWMREEIEKVPEGWSASDFTIANKRPQRSFQIYDTTPQAANPDHLQTLAEEFQTELCKDHGVGGRNKTARIDVWAKPFAADASAGEEMKIDTCKAHILAEIAARETSGDNSFHVSELCSHVRWKRFLLIMDQPEESWNEDEGGFLAVYWDPHSSYQGTPEGPETHTRRYTREELGTLLEDITNFF
ncbi:uncharacterized protein EKO05_0005373 [Ascochyta rabiei]|uniref:Uncharacterized protein n=1 Tax=Didymella rabiei TaxID=5454 RepID=A0A163JTP3_DIDRA|nr:uncharacterized protein EKO05_0005373 [Ascochyta rabiei]KZM26589.1 hypothetical protein ST47_g2234 [Ascochyta rabiei]UPX14902.1 hypothetical protein EKO05_0005373 [Ascochyta rabiei]